MAFLQFHKQIYNYLQSDSHKLSRLMGCCPNILNIPLNMTKEDFVNIFVRILKMSK